MQDAVIFHQKESEFFFHAVYNIMKEEKINDKVTKQCHYRLWYFLQN